MIWQQEEEWVQKTKDFLFDAAKISEIDLSFYLFYLSQNKSYFHD